MPREMLRQGERRKNVLVVADRNSEQNVRSERWVTAEVVLQNAPVVDIVGVTREGNEQFWGSEAVSGYVSGNSVPEVRSKSRVFQIFKDELIGKASAAARDTPGKLIPERRTILEPFVEREEIPPTQNGEQ